MNRRNFMATLFGGALGSLVFKLTGAKKYFMGMDVAKDKSYAIAFQEFNETVKSFDSKWQAFIKPNDPAAEIGQWIKLGDVKDFKIDSSDQKLQEVRKKYGA